MHPDCHASQAVLQRSLTGLSISPLDLELALEHVASCTSCEELLSPHVTFACAKVEADIDSYAVAVSTGRDARRRWPALARHLDGCERCAEIVAELVEPCPASGAGRPSSVPPAELFERALVGGLVDPDPIVRRRAAALLGRER